MAQTAPLIATLKACLKANGKTYADVAAMLELSEASVKRLFAEESLSLERLDSICHLIGMEISDLVKQMEASRNQLIQLSYKQEREITEDLELMLVTVCVFNFWPIEEIVRAFTISMETCIKKLLKLEKIGIIELMPGNRVRLVIDKHFKWLPNGPFEQFFRTHIGKEFFNASFEGEHHCLQVMNGTLSQKNANEFNRKLQRLAREFSDMNREDAALPMEQREGVTLVMAMRSWDFGMFKHLIREE